MPITSAGRQGLGWTTGGRRDPATPGRLGAFLVLSLVLHTALAGVAWREFRPDPGVVDDLTFVDLAPPFQTIASLTTEAGSTGAGPGAGETSPVERSPEPLAAPQAVDLNAAAGTRSAAPGPVHEGLRGQLASLTTENAELSARLAAERERAAALERQLEEAREAERARLARVKADYDELVSALQGEIADKVIALGRAQERLTVTIVDRVLFPSGQATLTAEGRQVMARVGKVLGRVADRGILVEGHTDDVPIGPSLSGRFPSNWELSAARATEVVRYLVRETGVPAEHLRAAGRADTEPAASNASEDGRRQNRRIEIILLPPDDATGARSPS